MTAPTSAGRRWIVVGPRMGNPAAEPWDGEVLAGEPGVAAIGFKEHASALAHFLRATTGSLPPQEARSSSAATKAKRLIAIST